MQFADNIYKKYFDGLKNRYYQKIKDSQSAIILWGAGGMSVNIIAELAKKGFTPECFCDSDPNRWGKEYMGLAVKSYDEIVKEYPKRTFIISFANTEEVYPKLKSLGEKVYRNRLTSIVGEQFDYDFFVGHTAEFEAARGMLADDKSKLVFDNLILYRLTCDAEFTKSIRDGDQYFPSGIIRMTDNEIFADVGAYHGETSLEFLKRVNYKYNKIFIFEPDGCNICRIKALPDIAAGRNIVFIEAGAWDRPGTLNFTAVGTSGAHIEEERRGEERTPSK